MRNSMNLSRKLAAAATTLLPPAFLVAAGLFAGSAWADEINIPLTQPNAAISGFPSPYGNVNINLNAAGTVATITFTADETHANAYTFGDGGVVDLNVNGAYTLGPVTETNTLVGGGFTPSFDKNSPGQVDGFGTFSLSLNNNDGFGDSATSVSFTLTGSWLSAANVLVANSQGSLAAAHVFVCTDSPTTCSATGSSAPNTGYAANGGAVSVPAPMVGAGLPGLVLACGGLLTLARRRRQNLA
jgi:hypothetical protein